MVEPNLVIIGPSPFKLVRSGLMITGGVACGLLGLALARFGLDWLLSLWPMVILMVTGALAATLVGIGIVGGRPQVEIEAGMFTFRTLFGSRSRPWSAIEGSFTAIRVGLSRAVGYRLAQGYKQSAGIKSTKAYAGNDEVIAVTVLDLPAEKLAELLNQRKEASRKATPAS
jgi:hypothetical protein